MKKVVILLLMAILLIPCVAGAEVEGTYFAFRNDKGLTSLERNKGEYIKVVIESAIPITKAKLSDYIDGFFRGEFDEDAIKVKEYHLTRVVTIKNIINWEVEEEEKIKITLQYLPADREMKVISESAKKAEPGLKKTFYHSILIMLIASMLTFFGIWQISYGDGVLGCILFVIIAVMIIGHPFLGYPGYMITPITASIAISFLIIIVKLGVERILFFLFSISSAFILSLIFSLSAPFLTSDLVIGELSLMFFICYILAAEIFSYFEPEPEPE